MTSTLDTHEAPHTTVPVRRDFLRLGTKTGKGILKYLTWGEAYVFLQVIWNGPVRSSRIFGIEQRYKERCLAKLLRLRWIERTEDGYRMSASLQPQPGGEHSYLWCFPLRATAKGYLSVAARVLLCLIDEYTGGRRWCNRTELAESLGIHRDTLYKYLRELYRKDLISMSGRGITCCRHMGKLGDEALLNLSAHCEYGGEEDPAKDRSVSDTAPVGLRHETGRSPTRGLPLWKSVPDQDLGSSTLTVFVKGVGEITIALESLDPDEWGAAGTLSVPIPNAPPLPPIHLDISTTPLPPPWEGLLEEE